MSSIGAAVRRHRLLVSALVGAVVVLAAIPLVAYVIVPQFVRSTVNEAAPVSQSTPSSGGGLAQSTPPATTTIASGQLKRINTVDFGSGSVAIIQVGSQRFVRFDNVEISGAPAQHVYLSDRTDGTPGNFTDLGALKATNGSFNYEIPAAVDLAKVKSVVSWCTQFNTVITYAPLQPA